MSAGGDAGAARLIPAALDPVTGMLVRAVIPVPHGTWYARYREGDQRWVLEVVAWAECVTPDGVWGGLLPVVSENHATAVIADPRTGFTGITRDRRGWRAE